MSGATGIVRWGYGRPRRQGCQGCADRPDANSVPTGTVWRCGRCLRTWIVYYFDTAAGWGGNAWRRKRLPFVRREGQSPESDTP